MQLRSPSIDALFRLVSDVNGHWWIRPVLLQRMHVIVESGVGGCIVHEIDVDLGPWIGSHRAAFCTKRQTMAFGFILTRPIALLDLDSPLRIRIHRAAFVSGGEP